MNPARPGWVYLVGAGPGDPGLITARGLELLRNADTVLFDRLVTPELLAEASPRARLSSVAKQSEGESPSQAEIDAQMIAAAREGRSVVRLKGGDPYVLGRGADEAQALAAAGIPFEVVPGVSSAVAAPSYAGIPLTHGGVASSIAITTGHEADPQHLTDVAAADSIVVLMGVRTLAKTSERLIEAGRSPDEPAALIQWGTTPRQRVVVGTLADIEPKARSAEITPPATLIVGKVVRLRGALNWFEQRPLFGRRIVVTRSRHQSARLSGPLGALGADVIHLPVISIEDPDSWEAADAAVARLYDGLYAWTIFASVNSVERFWQRAILAGFDARAFARTRIAAVGPATSRSLREKGLEPDLVPTTFTGSDLVEAIGHGGGVVLVPRVDRAPAELVDGLGRNGWRVDTVEVYRNVPADPPAAELELVRKGDYHAVAFTSASTVRNFTRVVSDIPNEVVVVSIGPATSKAAEEAGLSVAAEATEHTIEGVIDALVNQLASSRP